MIVILIQLISPIAKKAIVMSQDCQSRKLNYRSELDHMQRRKPIPCVRKYYVALD